MCVLSSERVVCSSSGTDRIDGIGRTVGIDGGEDVGETRPLTFFVVGREPVHHGELLYRR